MTIVRVHPRPVGITLDRSQLGSCHPICSGRFELDKGLMSILPPRGLEVKLQSFLIQGVDPVMIIW